MKIQPLVLSVLYSLCWCVVGWSQSILSINYPMGLPLNSHSSTAHQMGGVGVGVPNDHHVMLANPGNLGFISTIAFSSLLSIDYLRVRDGKAYTDHLNAIPRHISFAFPLKYLGTFGFSITKNTNASLKYRKTVPLGRVSFHREGGFKSWQVGVGQEFGKYIHVGIAYERDYFTIKQTKFTDNLNIDLYEKDSSIISFRGNGLRIGVMGTIENFTIGISGNYYFENTLTFQKALYKKSETPLLSTSETTIMQPPPSVSTGVSYSFSPKLIAGSDFSLTLWDYYSIEKKGILADVRNKNTLTFGIGTRFIPAPNLLVPKYWETIRYRTGLRYAQLPGKNSSEFSGVLGVGLPLRGNGLFDVGMELGNRHHNDIDDFNEVFLSFSIGINGGGKFYKNQTNTY